MLEIINFSYIAEKKLINDTEQFVFKLMSILLNFGS